MDYDLEQQLEDELNRFKEIMYREPRFYHDADDDNSPTCVELVTLVFDDGREVRLRSKGTSTYDYVELCRPKYSAEPTAKQIELIIAGIGREPIAVKYWFKDQTKKKPQLMFEFPYDSIKAVLQGKADYSAIEFVYEVVGRD